MLENQKTFFYACFLGWSLLYIFKIIIVFAIDKENRNKLLSEYYPVSSYTNNKVQITYLMISFFSSLFIGLNMFLYSSILKDMYPNDFINYFKVFCFYFIFWLYLFISSFYEFLGFWGIITKISVILTFISYIGNSYNKLWIAIIFLVLGILYFFRGFVSFMKLGSCSGNPYNRTEDLIYFFLGITNCLFMIYFMFSPIIYSKFICI